MSTDNPMQPVVAAWLRVIRAGVDKKRKRFGADAEECMRFLTGPYDFFWRGLKTDRHLRSTDDSFTSFGSGIQVQTNKVAEFVQLFGPSLYARNPTRRVTPRALPELPAELYAMMGPGARLLFEQAAMQDQMERLTDASRAGLIECLLNATPPLLDLRYHARMAVDEALIKGMGTLWQEPCRLPGAANTVAGSFYRSVDDLVIDPDARSLQDAQWVALRCEHPTWEAERANGLPPGALSGRGQFESTAQAAAAQVGEQTDYWGRRTGESNDVIVYWKVWSKMGCGGRIRDVVPELRPVLDAFGDYCYVVVADGVPWPLNLPPDVMAAQDGLRQASRRLQWPTPAWVDGGWPFTPIAFHEVPGDPWPLAHLAPAMGELKFLNWAFGHVAAKIRATTRDFVAVLASAGDDIKSRILHGNDLELLEIQEAHGKRIDEVVAFLQHPSFNGDIWTVMEAVMGEFEKRSGLNELMYGMSGKQIRSGTEAQLRGDAINIRPDDMAEQVEAAMSRAGRYEALVARWHCTPEDVAPVLGPVGAYWYQQLVYAADPRDLLSRLTYRVEAGSARKPNRARDQEQAQAMMNNLFSPFFQVAAQTGNYRPVNGILKLWAKAQEVENADEFLLSPPPMPPAALPPAGGGGQPPAGGPPQ